MRGAEEPEGTNRMSSLLKNCLMSHSVSPCPSEDAREAEGRDAGREALGTFIGRELTDSTTSLSCMSSVSAGEFRLISTTRHIRWESFSRIRPKPSFAPSLFVPSQEKSHRPLPHSPQEFSILSVHSLDCLAKEEKI